MNALDKVKSWVETGRQIGKTISFEEEGETYSVSVAVQKWGGLYKVYFNKLSESQIDYLDSEAEEIIEVENFESLAGIIEAKASIRLDELAPLKGQRIFNPAF